MENEGSTYKVPYTTILAIGPHDNADRLEIATVYGFQVVVAKGKYQVGDKVIYVPIDSILPTPIENILFPEDSKIKLHKSRVRQIRIRKVASQGMLIDPKDLSAILNFSMIPLETDLKAVLGVKKYEPPQELLKGPSGKPGGRTKKDEHPLFHKYNGLDNIKWFPNKFKEGDQVVIQEKLHGTNARASILPFQANTLWKRIKKAIGLAPKFEQCYGSNNVEISAKSEYKGFYGDDIYGNVFKELDVFSKIKPGETIFGEIIGEGIQKNYTYGVKGHVFVLFDVKVLQPDGKQVWLSPSQVKDYAIHRGFELVPYLYEGPFNKEYAYSLTKGASVYCPDQKIREGIVIKAREDYSVEGNKQALKWVSEDYLDDKDNSDFH